MLITRPEPEAERTQAALAALGHDVIRAPVLAIEPSDNAAFGAGPWDAALATSANALRAIARHPRLAELAAVPLFAVGRRTAEAAKSAGFAQVVSADSDEQALVKAIEKSFAGRRARFLYLAGEEQARDLAGDLLRAGFQVQTAVVYRAVAARRLPEKARADLSSGRIDGVLHYSRRSAEAFVRLAEAAGVAGQALAAAHFCLSEQVAEPLASAGARRIMVAAKPDEPSLFRLLPA